VLVQVATTLQEICREGDVAGRYGGDEFALLLRGATVAEARAVMRRLSAAVRTRPHMTPSGAVIPLSVAVGMACFPADGRARHELVTIADDGMYAAKRGVGLGTPMPLERTGRAGEHASTAMSAAEQEPAGADGGWPWQEENSSGLPNPYSGTVAGRAGGQDKEEPVALLRELMEAVDARDRYTRAHAAQATRLALLLAGALELQGEQRRALALAGPLHDVGKIASPERVLRKPGRLTEEEREVLQRHVPIGVVIMRGVLDNADVLDAVAYHHERWDGRGYPYGLPGPATPLLGRVMQLASAVAAMMLDRPYRHALPWSRVVSELRAGAASQFDPALVDLFVDVAGPHLGAAAPES
jgi:HD-GYP domain-containing protein (c-di-GMP phosphodiesterase class II)